MRGIRRFLESWTTLKSRRFLAGCLYDFGVLVCTLLSLFLLRFSSFLSFPPPHVARYVNVILPKLLVLPIRGTSPARFFVKERISRLIDEWRDYGIHYAADMCPRCSKQRSAVSYYTLDTPIFRRIAANTRRRVARQKKELQRRRKKKDIISKIRDTRRIFLTFSRPSIDPLATCWI